MQSFDPYLGAPPPDRVTVGADGAQHLSTSANRDVIALLSVLYLIPGTPVQPGLLPQGANVAALRAVPCDVWRTQLGVSPTANCGETALAFLNRSGRIVVIDIENITTEQVDILLFDAAQPQLAVAFSPPGSPNALLQPAAEGAPAPTVIARKDSTATTVLGALAGAGLGFIAGGPAGAVAGGVGGAVVGNVVGRS